MRHYGEGVNGREFHANETRTRSHKDQETTQKETGFLFFALIQRLQMGSFTKQKMGSYRAKDAVKFKEGATSQKHGGALVEWEPERPPESPLRGSSPFTTTSLPPP